MNFSGHMDSSQLLLLAQAARVDELGQRFKYGGGFDPANIAILVCVLLCIAGMAWLLTKFSDKKGERRFNDPRQLFTELCRAHRLSFWERTLLKRVVEARELIQPAEVFLQPAHLDRDTAPPRLRRYGDSMAALRRKLFDG